MTVTPPGRESLEAWNVLGSATFGKKYGELIQTPWRAKLSVDDLQQLNDIVTLYPDSVYAQYIALYLGRWYLESPQKNSIEARRFLTMAKDNAPLDFVKQKATALLSKDANDNVPQSP